MLATLKIKWVIIVAIASLIVLSGCSVKPSKYPVRGAPDSSLMSEAYNAVDNLTKQSHVFVNEKHPIVVASFSDINNLTVSTTFGRMISQLISSRFTQQGYSVVELLLRSDIYIKQNEGEFLLSRAVKNVTAQHNAQAVVVGTYAVGTNAVFVTTKVIRTRDNVVLGSSDFTLPMTADVKSLLGLKR